MGGVIGMRAAAMQRHVKITGYVITCRVRDHNYSYSSDFERSWPKDGIVIPPSIPCSEAFVPGELISV